MNKEMTAVLVGCGNISQVWLSAIQEIPEIKIVGLVDIIEKKASIAAEQYGLLVNIDTDLSTSLRNNQPDVVFVCTTPESRLNIISLAFKNGCHVLIEKPLANSIDEAKKIVSLAKKENKICAVIQNHRYDMGIRRLSRLIKTGALGEITFCNTSFFIGSRFEGFRHQMKHVLLHDMAIHTFDSVRAIIGADPVSVFCKEWNPKGSWFKHDASAVAIFEFSNGIIYTYQGSWCSQGLRTPWESEWRINGTKGSVVWNGGDKFNIQVLGDSNNENSHFIDQPIPELDLSDKIGGHAGVIADFINCIRIKHQPETICNDNIKSLQMVHAAVKSSECETIINII